MREERTLTLEGDRRRQRLWSAVLAYVRVRRSKLKANPIATIFTVNCVNVGRDRQMARSFQE